MHIPTRPKTPKDARARPAAEDRRCPALGLALKRLLLAPRPTLLSHSPSKGNYRKKSASNWQSKANAGGEIR